MRALLVLALLGCNKGPPDGARQLPAEELRALYRGHSSEGRHELRGYSFKRYYAPDGRVLSQRDDATPVQRGQWWIDGDQLCLRWETSGPNPTPGLRPEVGADFCRRVLTDGHGHYWKLLERRDGQRRTVVSYTSFIHGDAWSLDARP